MDDRHRRTLGTVDRIAESGTIFVHEMTTGKLGYIANNTPLVVGGPVRPGMRLKLVVEDRGDVMVVESAEAAG